MSGFIGALAGGILRNTVRFFFCAAFTGLAVKIMDDWLDRGRDKSPRARLNFADRLGEASLPYALFTFACAVPFDARTAVALFLMCYALGMVWEAPGDQYPSGLRGWQESLLAAFACLAACGWRLTVVAGLCIAAIQCYDDVMDYRISGARAAPLVRRFGLVEVTAGATLAVVLALGIDMARTLGAVLGAFFIWAFEGSIGRDWEPPI